MSVSSDDSSSAVPIELQNFTQSSANSSSESNHNDSEAKSNPMLDMTKEESKSNENENWDENTSPVLNEFKVDSSVLEGNFFKIQVILL